MIRRIHGLLILLLLTAFTPTIPTQAAAIATDPFERTWQRTDRPVAEHGVQRTWMWGPEPFTDARTEAYADAPGGSRTVQYFDKSRMEDNSYRGSAPWDVTNGLLVVELMSGEMQVGDGEREPRQPARINVAGDPDDPLTYAVLAGVRGHAPLPTGSVITQRIDASGQVSDDSSMAAHGVTALVHEAATNHVIASPFWHFMTATGTVYEDGGLTTAPLFESPYYATGLPITEAYWANVKVGGQQRDVLLQCFERRCLTYTPDNPAEWQVEAGNVGQHYYRWRYPDANPGPSPLANDLARKVTQATSDDARYAALLDVMDALNVGVYSGSGQMILGGAERGAADFYLYDIELRMMAGALGRGQTFGVVDLAMQLMAMGLLPEGQTLDPNVVRSAILTIAGQAEQAPDEFTSLSPLLVRQLGLSQAAPYDLFTDVSLDAMRFDALAFFLLVAQASVPLIEEQLPLPNGASSDLIAQSNGVLKLAAASTPCDPAEVFNGDAFKNAYGWAKNFADLLGLLHQTIVSVTAILDAVHGAILAFSVGVTELDQRLETHYGPGGHESEAGQPVTFRILVEMRDELPQALIDCGWITGTDFPPKGPISGVSVHWFWDNLDEHGQIDCGGACLQTPGNGLSIDATDASGIARMTFQPKEEENPDEGWIVEEHGVVTGVALYQSKFTNLLGSYGQYLTPKSGATRWVVKWHEVPGWDVEMKLTYDIKRMHADDWFWWGKGSMTFQARIDSQGFEGPAGWPASATASGSGTYGYTPNPPVSCAWSGAWQWPTHAVEILDRDQLLVDFIGGLGPVPAPGLSGTTHPFEGDCNIAADLGLIPSHYPPAFSLKTEEKQVFDVAPQGMDLDSGAITWEITVTPRSQP